MLTAHAIVGTYTKNRMSSRPEFYSGRGAILTDLNSELLEMIYDGIRREIGEAAAKNFVQMVADIDVLSATLFLNSLYGLEANGWKWKKRSKLSKTSKATDHVDIGPDDGHRFAIGMATIGSWLGGGSERNETPMISSDFLEKHGFSGKAWYFNNNYHG